MNQSSQAILERISKIGLEEMKEFSELAPFILFYHQVSALPPLPICPNPPVSPERVRSDLQLLTKLFRPLTVDELLWHHRTQKPVPKGSFMITFDDGLACCLPYAVPILEEFKLDGIFFVNTSSIGNRTLLVQHRTILLRQVAGDAGIEAVVKPRLAREGLPCERLDQIFVSLRNPARGSLLKEMEAEFGIDQEGWAAEHKPYLDEAQLDDLVKRGFTIGAHGRDHFRFREVPLELQLSEMAVSMRHVAERYKPKGLLFSFPFTADDVGFSFFELASKLNLGVEILFGTSAPRENPGMPWLLERFSAEGAKSTEERLTELIMEEIARRMAGHNIVERHP